MRASFIEYYLLSEKEIAQLWKEGLIVFDTNVLLSLYRISKEARDEILAVMKGYDSRLWLPHQVGYEYHENRLEQANNPIEALSGLEKEIEDFTRRIRTKYSNNPFVDIKKLDSTLKGFTNRACKLIHNWSDNCPKPVYHDSILEKLTLLYEGKIGSEYSQDKLNEIYTIGKERYCGKEPPGYKDVNKSGGDRHRYGDLIIWFQIMEYAQQEGRDVIFVTDDCKEDWWALYKDDKIGPRRELIREFRRFTGNHSIWFYTTDRFLEKARKDSGISVKSRTIDELKQPSQVWSSNLGMDSDSGRISALPFIEANLSVADDSEMNEVGAVSNSVVSANTHDIEDCKGE